ncbi:MAG: YceD family protein [Polaromonas sp.]|uniref:YceD family protein n=1 Tax=Polaromonas sp. TaxID=1869339 RepID=UPI002735A6F5|nr:YceD family protein [Polaromonas sp.]MDP2818811.1 YceD family protein [Polaromonas sp.]
MSKNLNAQRLNMPAFAQAGESLVELTPLQNMERLAQEIHGSAPDLIVNWRATGELRARTGADDDVWVHLEAKTSLPLTCQRCMGAVATSLKIDQWYRFVADEDIAMAEDDASEEDLLVMAPQFDLLAVVEDELLMALPLVPMHETCPVSPVFSAGEAELAPPDGAAQVKPHPFAALAQLKKPK